MQQCKLTERRILIVMEENSRAMDKQHQRLHGGMPCNNIHLFAKFCTTTGPTVTHHEKPRGSYYCMFKRQVANCAKRKGLKMGEGVLAVTPFISLCKVF